MERNSPLPEKRKPGRPSVDRRDQILDAAEQLYESAGFERTTISDVANALTMSPANLYRFFASRQAIDEAVAERRLRRIEDVAWAEARKASTDPAGAFVQMAVKVAETTADVMVNSGKMSDLCLAASRGKWPPVRAFLGTLHGAVRHVVAEGQRMGCFAKDLPLEATVRTIVNALMAVWHPVMLDANGVEALESQAGELARLVLTGLAKRNEE